MKIKIRVKTKPEHKNDRQPWEDELEQYKKMTISIVSPKYTESGEIKEYVRYQFHKDYIHAIVESGHLVLYMLVYQECHKYYARRCKFSDIDSGKPVDGVYIFSNEGKAVDKKNELNDKLRKDNKICCAVMFTEPYTYAKYSITIQEEEQKFEENEIITQTFGPIEFRANEVFYLTEDGIKHYGLDELLKEANKKGDNNV